MHIFFLGRKTMTNLDSILKSRDITLPTKVLLVKAMVSSSHVWMWELDYKESWAPKNWCFSTVILEKTLESPLDFKEMKPVHPKGDQSWVFIGRIHAAAETPILWPPDAKNWLLGKDPNAGKDWRQEEGDDRGWDGWMVSLTWWTWAWASSRTCRWTREAWHVAIHGSQRAGHDWATELNWTGASLVAKMVKNLLAMQETLVWSLGQEDPLEKGMATQSGILAWRSPWTEEPGGLQSMQLQRVGHGWVTNTFTFHWSSSQ